MLEQPHEWRVCGFVAGPEPREWQNALTANLLDQPALRKDDGEDVSKGGEGNEDAESTLRLWAEHIAEEGCGQDTSTADNLLAWDSGEVRNVGEHVQHADDTDGDRRRDLESPYGVPHLCHGIVCVGVADVAPDDVVESSDDTVCRASSPGEGIVEVVWLLNLEMAS